MEKNKDYEDTGPKKSKHLIQVCIGPRCSSKDSKEILRTFEEKLGIKCGEMNAHSDFYLETITCRNACDVGPNVIVDCKYHKQMNTGKVDEVIDQYSENKPLSIQAICPYCKKILEESSNLKLKAKQKGEECTALIEIFEKTIKIKQTFPFNQNIKIKWACPFCNMPLEEGGQLCKICQSDVISLEQRSGKNLWFCASLKCGIWGIEENLEFRVL